ncbi:MAG: hypothetical protein GKS04_03080 [Candidatus Mycalebacterium zealandia]|nr:MAG: hypothetical protein GKS04_03080 [Candidatus Mycalebacterium zealandia]
MGFIEAMERIREEFPNDNVKHGQFFEKMCKSYLLNDPLYENRFSDVWLWNEFPDRKEADTGVDIVAKEHSGALWAIQCNFYDENTTLIKKTLTHFSPHQADMIFPNG